VASGHLSPRLAELAEFLLAATVLVGTGRKPVNSEYMRKLLKEDGPELAVLLEFLDARRLCLRRSSSVVPPQIPAAPMCDAHRRHGPHTGQVRHICLASSIWSKKAPVVPMGKKSSGSASRQAA